MRDGRSVALSYAGVPYGPKTAARAANLWAKRVRRGLAARDILSPDRYLQLRYEELVAGERGQERQARAMCEFLGLDYDPSMLDYSEVARSEILGKSRLRNPYIVRRPKGDARSWKTQMPPRQVEMFEAVAGDVLSELGYERRFPSPGRRARFEATLALAGAPLGRLPRTPRSETDADAPEGSAPRSSAEGSEP